MLANLHKDILAEIFKFLTSTALFALSATSSHLRHQALAERDRRVNPHHEKSYVNICKTADSFLFLAYLSFKPTHPSDALNAAIDGGHPRIIEHAASLCESNAYVALSNSVERGNLIAVKSICAKDPNIPLKYYFEEACKSGHLEIVKYFMTKISSLDYCAQLAAMHGHIDIIKYIASQDLKKYLAWNMCALCAKLHGNMEIVSFINKFLET